MASSSGGGVDHALEGDVNEKIYSQGEREEFATLVEMKENENF